MLIEHHIPVTRRARFYTSGIISEKTKDIWILIHGHKQLAGSFLNSFSDLAKSGSYLFAPEGLMRQYIKGDSGNVGASWMTKEDRESDIMDYVEYLDKLYFDEVLPLAKTYSLKINTLGFSQGAATLSRWLTLGKAKADKAVFWCGSIAHDVDFSGFKDFKNTEIHQVFGSNDPYYDSNFSNSQSAILKKAGISPRVHIFEGGHEVSPKLMEEAGVLK